MRNSSSERVSSPVRSRNSFSSRVFSIAITACLVKFSTSATCLSANWRTSLANNRDRAQQLVVFQHGHCQHRPGIGDIDHSDNVGNTGLLSRAIS